MSQLGRANIRAVYIKWWIKYSCRILPGGQKKSHSNDGASGWSKKKVVHIVIFCEDF